MSLRRRVIQGGAFLAIRQGLGMAISVVGVLLLTRTIGPRSYGLYAAALGVHAYLQNVALWGIDVYLIRRPGDDRREVTDQAATLLLLLGTAAALLMAAAAPALGRFIKIEGFAAVARTMFAFLPLVVLGQVGLAQLERRLDYRRVAMVELAGQLLYYVVALPLAFGGAGAWAAVGGWITQQCVQAAGMLVTARYLPRPRWNRGEVREMMSYGLSFSSSIWVWQLRNLVNPLIVGRFAGASAVGILALAQRLVEYLGFVKGATWRLSIAALGQLDGDAPRLSRAIAEGMRLQLLAVGPFLVAFGWVAPWVVPALFGPSWLPALVVYPYIALAMMVNAIFNMHSSVLYVLHRNWDVTIFHLVHVVLLAAGALLLVPRYGLVGYGLAEIVAMLGYVVIHELVARQIGAPRYGIALLWCGAFGLALFVRELGVAATAGLIVAALWPATWVELSGVVRTVWQRT